MDGKRGKNRIADKKRSRKKEKGGVESLHSTYLRRVYEVVGRRKVMYMVRGQVQD